MDSQNAQITMYPIRKRPRAAEILRLCREHGLCFQHRLPAKKEDYTHEADRHDHQRLKEDWIGFSRARAAESTKMP